MGARLGCSPSSPYLQSSSVDVQALEKLSLQTRHLAPINEAFDAPPGSPPAPGVICHLAYCQLSYYHLRRRRENKKTNPPVANMANQGPDALNPVPQKLIDWSSM